MSASWDLYQALRDHGWRRLRGRRVRAGVGLAPASIVGLGCEPGALSLEDSHTATLRWTVPFMLRYVAQKPAFGKLLRARGAPPGVVVETARAR